MGEGTGMLSSVSEQRAPYADSGWDSTARLYAERINTPDRAVSGQTLILEVEDLYNRLSAKSLQQNPFWRALVENPNDVPDAVYHGTCVENYHLLYRESYFDSPALSYSFDESLRRKFNEFYCEELGHDRLLLQSLETIGLTAEELFLSVPLRETIALCNALSFWARHDPLFFFTTLGPLEGGHVEVDSYVRAMRRKNMPEAFIAPIETHANINRTAEHGHLTRELFSSVRSVSVADAARILQQTLLFIALYDQFYYAIWEYYSIDGRLLRPITDI
jgi:Iron-containing redox enzyme